MKFSLTELKMLWQNPFTIEFNRSIYTYLSYFPLKSSLTGNKMSANRKMYFHILAKTTFCFRKMCSECLSTMGQDQSCCQIAKHVTRRRRLSRQSAYNKYI